jgi:hypothetical protein
MGTRVWILRKRMLIEEEESVVSNFKMAKLKHFGFRKVLETLALRQPLLLLSPNLLPNNLTDLNPT